MKQILYCYGDSNTWGFDSRSWLGERYPKEVRWTGILEESLGCRVVNDGLNGRKIPSDDRKIDFLTGHIRKLLEECQEPEKELQLLIMLGTNDLLTNPVGGAADAAARMDKFLGHLVQRVDELEIECLDRPRESLKESGEQHVPEGKEICEAVRIRLIAPPPLCRGAWVETDELVRQSRLLGGEYREIAEKYKILFTDAGAWDIPLLYDGVHFSEEGHRAFAEGLGKDFADFSIG